MPLVLMIGLTLVGCQATSPAPLPTLAVLPSPVSAQASLSTPTPALRVVGVPSPTPPTSQFGAYQTTLSQPVGRQLGTLDARQPVHVYLLEGQVDQIVTLRLRRISGTLDPSLALYDPQFRLLAQDEASGEGRSARLLNIRLPQAGAYSVVVSGDGFYGDYELSLHGALVVQPQSEPTTTPIPITPYQTPTLGALASGTRLADHQPVLGLLGRQGDFARFAFPGQAGQVVSLGVRPLDEAQWLPQFEIYDPDGALLASARASQSLQTRTAQLLSLTLALDGVHTVLVTAEGGRGNGPFQLSWGLGPSYEERWIGLLAANQRVEGRLDAFGLRHTYLLRLNAGDVITAAVSPATQTGRPLDPYLELVRPADGQFYAIAADDNGGGGTTALIRLAKIEQSGDYLLRVRAARGDELGSYTLLWRYINLAPTPTPVPASLPLLVVDDSLSLGEYRFYSFQGRLGQRVRVQVRAFPGSGLDAVAALIDPQGREIAQGDDSPNSLDVDFVALLPADGSYQVRVNGYLSEGVYEVRVSALLE
ncbi:MAG: hypothetical protein NZ750_04870 [Anaerolineae bacterium]|nr:hypothetical protein [Anaerolineae bacterium]MDW8173792.1 hypothetical protein [Anaerolineae bacterium]